MNHRHERGPAERARDAAFREFVQPGALPEGARVQEAEARLGAMLEQELGVPLEEEPARAGAPEPAAAAPSAAPPLRHAPRPRHARTVWALAATVAVLAGVSWIALTTRPRDDQRLLRGAAPGSRSGAVGVWDAHPEIEASGRLGARLSWRPAPGADSYAVEFLSGGLDELAAVRGIADTSFVLTPATRPEGVTLPLQGLWRVVAYRGRDEIGRSPASPISLP